MLPRWFPDLMVIRGRHRSGAVSISVVVFRKPGELEAVVTVYVAYRANATPSFWNYVRVGAEHRFVFWHVFRRAN